MSEEDKHKEDEQTRDDEGDGQPDQSTSNQEMPVDDNVAIADDFVSLLPALIGSKELREAYHLPTTGNPRLIAHDGPSNDRRPARRR